MFANSLENKNWKMKIYTNCISCGNTFNDSISNNSNFSRHLKICNPGLFNEFENGHLITVFYEKLRFSSKSFVPSYVPQIVLKNIYIILNRPIDKPKKKI
ncbi:hypothetical protein BpHYR1_033397 [Brachionus plicatilis]|uniref:Uncharacterized protein n=1 Tax=Brachionus plicatilis TaxID=10195 RepID=A0A3M7Q2B8_BRAPC|nr:hypothetical protein BpHYR1_033397 [Brachionus plicatilis]